MLEGWAEQDEEIARQMVSVGNELTDEGLDTVMPERGVIEDDGATVGIVGMFRYGTQVAALHVYGSPDHRNYKDQSRAYDVALRYAEDHGIVVALGLIPATNKAAQLMALRKGFTVIPTVFMVKVLGNGN